MGQNLFKTVGEFEPDKLIADNAIPLTAKGVKIAAGQGPLKRGTLLGVSAKGGYMVTGSKETAGEGDSENEEAAGEGSIESVIGCDCILADDVDATEETISTAYVTGAFNRDAVLLAKGAEIENYENELRKLGIYLRGVQKQ